MSYELLKPYTDKQYADFVCEHQGLQTYENETAFYFLEANEIVVDGEIVINPDYDEEQANKKQLELVQYCYDVKAGKAYGGIIVNDTYTFETNEISITNLSATLIALQSQPDETQVNWKVYVNGVPTIINLTKVQLLGLFAFGMNMINQSFAVEGIRLTVLQSATAEQLNSPEWVQEFKTATQTAMDAVNNNISIELEQ